MLAEATKVKVYLFTGTGTDGTADLHRTRQRSPGLYGHRFDPTDAFTITYFGRVKAPPIGRSKVNEAVMACVGPRRLEAGGNNGWFRLLACKL